jgi:hypothetical protein
MQFVRMMGEKTSDFTNPLGICTAANWGFFKTRVHLLVAVKQQDCCNDASRR